VPRRNPDLLNIVGGNQQIAMTLTGCLSHHFQPSCFAFITVNAPIEDLMDLAIPTMQRSLGRFGGRDEIFEFEISQQPVTRDAGQQEQGDVHERPEATKTLR
jgi:hypothetical protein